MRAPERHPSPAERDRDPGPASRPAVAAREARPVPWAVCVALACVALVPRLAGLDRLSFYADEDLTAMAARAVVEEGRAVLPSGLEYRRALPLTWLAAASASVLGPDAELPYRLPAALLGALTVPALFLLGRSVIGGTGGFLAALLLLLSEWHLVFSRQARMYAPMLLFVVLAAWGLWTWARGGSRGALLGGILAYAGAVSFHTLGIVAAGLPLVWLAFSGAVAVSPAALWLVSSGLGAGGWLFGAKWVSEPYTTRVPLPPPAAPDRPPPEAPPELYGGMDELGIVLAIAGAAVGAWAAYRMWRPVGSAGGALRGAVRFALTMAVGAAAWAGHAYAFALAGAFLVIVDGRGLPSVLRHAGPQGALLAAGLVVQGGVHAFLLGPHDAAEAMLSTPYPHPYLLAQQFPLFTLAFGLACLWYLWRPDAPERRGTLACIATALGLLAAFGIVHRGEATRYLLPVYPFLLLVVAAGLRSGLARLRERGVLRAGWVPAAGALVVASGVLGAHGVPQAARVAELRHGTPVNPLLHVYPFHPDHRGPGRFVGRARAPGDVVIAEDPLVQRWYAGEIDYWFRRLGDMRRYLTRTADGGARDIYVGSRPLPEPASVDSLVRHAPGRVWLITSGETQPRADHYLTREQRSWLDSLRAARAPAYVGEDGVSAAYCLDCPSP